MIGVWGRISQTNLGMREPEVCLQLPPIPSGFAPCSIPKRDGFHRA